MATLIKFSLLQNGVSKQGWMEYFGKVESFKENQKAAAAKVGAVITFGETRVLRGYIERSYKQSKRK